MRIRRFLYAYARGAAASVGFALVLLGIVYWVAYIAHLGWTAGAP